MSNIIKEKLTKIMTEDPTGEELVNFAQQTAIRLVKANLTRSQIRNIFTEMRKIEGLWDPEKETGVALRRLTMLKPKLYYQSARSRQVDYLKDVLSEAIDYVNQAETKAERNDRFQRFTQLFEAILAYHRAEGGKN